MAATEYIVHLRKLREPPAKMDACKSVSSSIVQSVSIAWKHFGFEKDDSGKLPTESGAMCKLCKQKVAHGGGGNQFQQQSADEAYDEFFGSSLLENQSSL